MIPLYGFLDGDTMGLVILADENDTAEMLADKLQSAARLRVDTWGKRRVLYEGRELSPGATVASARMEAEGRFDVVRIGGK